MVKKTSLFSRLKNRWKPSSGVRVQSNPAAVRAARGATVQGKNTATATKDPVRPAAPAARSEPVESRLEGLPGHQRGEPRSSRKLSEREQAVLAFGEGFQELANLMRGVQTRIEGQGNQLADAVENLKMLPALGNTQLDMMRRMAAHLERQNQLGETMAQFLTGLPDTLARVEQALGRAAETDDRTAKSLHEFTKTMERIHSSMDQMVAHSSTQADATRQLAADRDEDHRQQLDAVRTVVDHLESSQSDALRSLRRTHEDQSNRLQHVVKQNAGWNRAVLGVLGVVVLGLCAVIAILVFK